MRKMTRRSFLKGTAASAAALAAASIFNTAALAEGETAAAETAEMPEEMPEEMPAAMDAEMSENGAKWETASTYVGADGPIVETASGSVLGYKLNDVYRFLGIPYAHANRFETAQTATWDGVFNANVYGPVCYIEDDNSINFTEFITPSAVTNQIQNEDCMNLNIWSPALGTDAKKPVIVWIHGGGYSSGSSTELKFYAGDNLCREGDVVVVSLNERLNVLGFLNVASQGDAFATSMNNGMYDLVVALQWIHDNIAGFGGDPENVTIVGQSGGGGKVLTLCAMPDAQGLFQKVIAESGTANPGSLEASARVGELTMEIAGCATIEELQALPYDTLIAAAKEAIGKAGEEGMNYNWGPVIDGNTLVEAPVADGKFTDMAKDVTLMVSTTLGEFSGNSVAVSKGFPGDYDINKTEEEAMALLEEKYGDAAQGIADAFRAAYPAHNIAEAAWTDTGFFSGAASAVAAKAAQAAEGGAPVYQYLFALNLDCYNGCVPPHCMEIIFFMHNVEMVPEIYYPDNQAAKDLQDVVCQAYASFAYTGVPMVEGIDWAPYTMDAPCVMVFDAESYVTTTEVYDVVDAIAAAAPASMW